MKLKRLCLAGFKTFADRTEIELAEGITAVVGPNGCGKSNIADAILWALGEQNPRLLRGTEGREFVFAGAERRKPLGMAEVQLIIDNSDCAMPLDFAEVAIARRVYRSGETRYAINGTSCRLKDIVDLFLDTGMGRGAYSFISQREVDAVLSARPEDRRELLEEAAGVQKYRTRKREAVRRLEVSESNLTRINDVVAELERQREPLRGQAGVAERYLAAAERLRTVEVGLLISEVHRSDYELYASRRDRDECIESVRELDGQLATMERDAARGRETLAAAEREQEAASLSRQGAATHVERTEHQLQLTLEREANARQAADALEQDMRSLAGREQTLAHDLQRERASLTKAESAESDRREALNGARARLAELEAATERAEEAGRETAQAQRRLMGERAAREAALASCRARADESSRRIAELDEELSAHVAAVAEVELRARAAQDQAGAGRKAAEAAEAERRSALESRRRADDLSERSEADAATLRRRCVERLSRLEALQEMQAAGEGLFQGVRSVLAASAEGELKGGLLTVADALRVPERLRTALDVALGSSAQNIICSSSGEARDAIEWLKATRRGRATFLPLDSLQPPSRIEDAELRRARGCIGAAADMVSADAAYGPAVELLLGRVVVMEDLGAALVAARRLSGWHRIVTLDGELLTPGGAITGGAGAARGPQLINRKGEIDDLAAETKRLGEELAAAEHGAAEARRAAEAAAAQADEATRRSGRRASELAAAERDEEAAARELASAHSRREDLEAQARRTRETLDRLAAEGSEWEAALATGPQGADAPEATLSAAQAEVTRCAGQTARARDDVQTIEVELGRLVEHIRGLRRAIAGAESALDETRAARHDRQAQRETLGRTISDAERLREDLTVAGEDARRALEDRTAHHDHWRSERARRLEAGFRITGAIREATSRRAECMEALHDTDLRIARLEVRLSQFAERLSDDYSETLEEALSAPEPPQLDRDTVNEIARLRREIRAMGNVNTGAAEEFRRLTERFDFLAGQRADLEQACGALRETIAEIDRSTRAVFMSTFEAVGVEFQKLFVRLFEGGQTRLDLTKPDDLLETGIEIIVQPPGKRLQSLSLLSGGERALTAVALLFSFLAVRPSPFVLLDEVDAPLDGPNVDRFVGLVRDFSKDTQFVIITHNPTTMAGAPRWYGVTMQEPGVSRVIAYRPVQPERPATSDAPP